MFRGVRPTVLCATAVVAEPISPSYALDILRGLESKQDGDNPVHQGKFVVGTNTCIDRIVSATETMARFRETNEMLSKRIWASFHPDNHEVLLTPREVMESFLYHFDHGIAGERVVEDEAVFVSLLNAIGDEFTDRLGGNAALMSTAAADLNQSVALVGPTGPAAYSFAQSGLRWPTIHQDGDEFHVILEYSTGDTIGQWEAPRANRFILTHDAANADPSLWLPQMVKSAKVRGNADVIILAGLHMMERLPETEWQAKFHEIARDVSEFPLPSRIHLEVASMAHQPFETLFAQTMLHRVDSIGLNEQELAGLYRALGGAYGRAEPIRSRKDLVATIPSVEAVQQAIMFIAAKAGGRLSRVHFHSFAFHILAQVTNSALWQEPARAAAAASVVATVKACGVRSVTDLSANDVEWRAPTSVTPSGPSSQQSFSPTQPVIEWSRFVGGAQEPSWTFALVPVVPCKNARATVGLGDAISATGLVYHVWYDPHDPHDEL